LGEASAQLSYQGSASLSVAILEDGQASSEACLKRADAAMYLAKSVGRNRICFDVAA
jgi:PleD family two-component response regulator